MSLADEPPDLLKPHLWAFMAVQGAEEASVSPDELDASGVFHVIGSSLADLLVEDVPGLCKLLRFLLFPGQGDNPFVEVRHVVFEERGRVTGRVDADKDNPQLVGIRTELLEDLCRLRKRGRADIRAMGEAVEPGRWFAEEVTLGNGLAVLIGELEKRK